MAYVTRDGGGRINSATRWPVDGLQQEAIADTVQEVIDFLARPAFEDFGGKVDASVRSQAGLRGLVRLVAKDKGISFDRMMDFIKAESD